MRSSWLFGSTGRNFVRTMLRLGAERDEVAVVDDQRGCPTYVGHLADATRALVDGGAPFGVWHLAATGDCTWADFAEAIFEDAGVACRVRRITSAEFGARAPRPAYSVLRSERPQAPMLPHWRDGLRACLAALAGVTRAPRRPIRPERSVPFSGCACSSPAGRGSSARTSSSGCSRPGTTSSCSTS